MVVAAAVKLLGSVAKSTESIGFLSTCRRRAVVEGLAVMETVEADILGGNFEETLEVIDGKIISELANLRESGEENRK